jgi:hypothetical protein
MPLQATSGAASYDAFGGGVPFEPIYIEQVFQNWLYTGNGSTQTITNGIDESGKGALTWIKQRSTAGGHQLYDTARGATQLLSSNNTNAQSTFAAGLTSFNANGFSLGNGINCNTSGETYASWTFREQPKFFDVVTWTGNGTTQAISHNLGSVPGFIIIKRTSSAEDWWCFHRYDFTQRFKLNATNAAVNTNNQTYLGDNSTAVSPTSTTFTIGNTSGLNSSGDTFVAYLFAHDAGGFGLTGTDNVISCGSFTTDGSGNATVDLGYEPQWVMYKRSNGTGSWAMFDNMRGMTVNTTNGDAILFANLADAESTVDWIQPTATGFNPFNIATSATYIYIAIRRGPMKVPTTGTSVYATDTRNGTAPNPPTFNSGFPVDWALSRDVSRAWDWVVSQRLTGNFGFDGISTAAQSDLGGDWGAFDFMDGFNRLAGVDANYRSWMMRRAPGFMDVVCWYGDPATVTHNLTVVPELVIQKNRTTTQAWSVWRPGINYGFLNTTAAFTSYTGGSATSTTFTPLQTGSGTSNYVSYLFATCPGVSKCGSYTGNGSSQTINCGFTGGARFILIKRTDSTGDWYVWDTARGIVAGDDPHLSLNTTAAEVTTDDTIDTDSTGFVVNQVAATNVNVSSATYIFLAIA